MPPLGAISKPRPVKLGYKETRELEELPAKIEILEKEQEDINLQLSLPAIYEGNPMNARVLQERLVALEQELMQHLDRWEELEKKQAAGHKHSR
jgi:ABC transport system ATP-binding/permease protein